jgi:hypothetical protein
MAVVKRGLKNIRTLSARVNQFSLPYRSYTQISCLEMEKARRGVERKSISERMAMIDARLQDIEKAKQELLEAVALPGHGRVVQLSGLDSKPLPRRGSQAFKIRY